MARSSLLAKSAPASTTAVMASFGGSAATRSADRVPECFCPPLEVGKNSLAVALLVIGGARIGIFQAVTQRVVKEDWDLAGCGRNGFRLQVPDQRIASILNRAGKRTGRQLSTFCALSFAIGRNLMIIAKRTYTDFGPCVVAAGAPPLPD
jgi:hypothetical protein